MWPFDKKIDFKEGSFISDAAFVRASLGADSISTNDNKYTRLSRKGLKALAEKYIQPLEFDYKPEVYDCDDAANSAIADMVIAANKIKLEFPIAFGTMNYKRKDGKEHCINIAFTSDSDILYYEPRTRKWMDTVKDMEKISHIQM